MIILSVESSCDETAVALVRDGREVLADAIASQIEMHTIYGGVVPEIASRKHLEAISLMADQALSQAGLTRSDIDAVACTYAPGLIGAVLVGVNFAKSVAYGLNVPLIPVHHIRGHDDAAGECFDKVARVLGIGYPGGGPMDRLAQGGDAAKYPLPRSKVDGAPLDMSFSGLKTAALNTIHNAEQKGENLDLPSFAASFGQAVSDELVPRVMEAAKLTGRTKIAAAGGVSANSRIRGDLEAACAKEGCQLYLPELKLCGDNGAMIGSQAYYEFLAGNLADSALNGYASRPIDR